MRTCAVPQVATVATRQRRRIDKAKERLANPNEKCEAHAEPYYLRVCCVAACPAVQWHEPAGPAPLFSAATMGCGRHAASHAEREKDRRSHSLWECGTRRGRAQRTGRTAGDSMRGNSVRRAREESSSGTPGGRTASTGRTCTRAECGGHHTDDLHLVLRDRHIRRLGSAQCQSATGIIQRKLRRQAHLWKHCAEHGLVRHGEVHICRIHQKERQRKHRADCTQASNAHRARPAWPACSP